MSKKTQTLDSNSTTSFPIVISLGLGLLMLGLSRRLFTIFAIGSGLTWLFRCYQKQQKYQQDCLDFTFYQLIRENQGYVTAIDLAMKSKLPGKVVQEFLEQQAKAFAAELEITKQGGLLYYFPTAISLIASQEKEEVERPKNQILAAWEKSSKLKNSVGDKSPCLTEKVVSVFGDSIYDTHFRSEGITQRVSNHQTLQKHSQVSANLKPPTENYQFESTNKIVSLSLTQKELASRLNVHSSTISKRKTKPDFSQWSRQKDPESIAWEYVKEKARFLRKKCV